MALSQEFISLMRPGMRAGEARDVTKIVVECLLAGAILLLVCQLLMGTSIYFAAGVFLTLLMVIFTWRLVGFGSIAGLLIAVIAFNFLVVSQIAKTIYGQPGETNISAPET